MADELGYVERVLKNGVYYFLQDNADRKTFLDMTPPPQNRVAAKYKITNKCIQDGLVQSSSIPKEVTKIVHEKKIVDVSELIDGHVKDLGIRVEAKSEADPSDGKSDEDLVKEALERNDEISDIIKILVTKRKFTDDGAAKLVQRLVTEGKKS